MDNTYKQLEYLLKEGIAVHPCLFYVHDGDGYAEAAVPPAFLYLCTLPVMTDNTVGKDIDKLYDLLYIRNNQIAYDGYGNQYGLLKFDTTHYLAVLMNRA